MPKFKVQVYRQIPLTVEGTVLVDAKTKEEAESKAIALAKANEAGIEYYSVDPSNDVSDALQEGNFLPDDIQIGEAHEIK